MFIKDISSSAKYMLKGKYTHRAYQFELAKHGLDGKNYIISLPTGAGKTMIAAIIIADNLQKNPSGKVALTVPTEHLAEQQKQKLQQYINGIKVECVTGSRDNDVFPLVSSFDVIVCTMGKLRYEIEGRKLNVNSFTLMIVDECHHVIGHNDGVYVMLQYLEQKLATTPHSQRLPQVVGMSASLGTGAGKSVSPENAIGHQIGICARLDATYGVRMVEINKDELKQYVNNPESHLVMQKERCTSEPFLVILKSTMEKLENMIQESPSTKGTEQYQKWVENEMLISELKTSSEERHRYAVLNHLLIYNAALIVYLDFTIGSAKEIINSIEPFDENTVSQREKELNILLSTLKQQIEYLEMFENPLLHQLESTVYSQYSKSDKMKGIVFVRTIQATEIICKWIATSEMLKASVRVASIVSFSRGGMAKNDQLDTINSFKRGDFNLLVSTPVLEEGLDVPDCNFIVRYLYVPNEIAHRQTMGRARAKDSHLYIIITQGSNMSYQQKLQEKKSRIEEVATERVCDLSKSEKVFDISICQKQQNIVEYHRSYEMKRAKQRREWEDPSMVQLLCRKCKTNVCKGSDVYSYGNVSAPHYIVPNKDFSQRYTVKEPKYDEAEKKRNYGDMVKLYKMHCKKCSEDWGIIEWWKSLSKEFPLLKAESFTFTYYKATKTFKKWKSAPFQVNSYYEVEELEETDVHGVQPCKESRSQYSVDHLSDVQVSAIQCSSELRTKDRKAVEGKSNYHMTNWE